PPHLALPSFPTRRSSDLVRRMSDESSRSPRPRAGRTTAGRRRLRHRLTLAAIEKFLEQGYEATTVDEIASAAGVGRRTFFRYFRDRKSTRLNSSHVKISY